MADEKDDANALYVGMDDTTPRAKFDMGKNKSYASIEKARSMACDSLQVSPQKTRHWLVMAVKMSLLLW